MKVKASPELGKLLTRAVEALETIAAAAQAITALDRAASSEAERWREYDRLSEPEAVPGHEWVYSSSEGWQLVPDEEIVDSGATEEVSGTMQLDVGPLDRREPGKPGRRSGLLLPHDGDERRSIPERRKPVIFERERRNSAQATRRDGDAERRQGDERRVEEAHVNWSGRARRETIRRMSDMNPDCLPRRQEGDDLHGRREIVLPGDSFDEVSAASDEAEAPQQREERRSPPVNRRGETEQRMRTRRRPHDRRKRAVGPGWLENMRSGVERRSDVDLRVGHERRFSDGRRDCD